MTFYEKLRIQYILLYKKQRIGPVKKVFYVTLRHDAASQLTIKVATETIESHVTAKVKYNI